MHNVAISVNGAGLTRIGSKFINIQTFGTSTTPIAYIYRLGGTTEPYRPLIQAANLDTNT